MTIRYKGLVVAVARGETPEDALITIRLLPWETDVRMPVPSEDACSCAQAMAEGRPAEITLQIPPCDIDPGSE